MEAAIARNAKRFGVRLTEKAARPNRLFSIYELSTVRNDIHTLFDAAEQGDNKAIYKFSTTRDFDIDAKDKYGRTALIWAADCGQLQACAALIRLSADIHIADQHSGRTAIHWAARSGNLGIVQLLVQYGGDFNKEDTFGLTPLYLAKAKGPDGEDVFNYLLAEGAAYNEFEAANVRLAQIAAEAAIAATMAAIDARNSKGNDEDSKPPDGLQEAESKLRHSKTNGH